jgi:hypothetical protein
MGDEALTSWAKRNGVGYTTMKKNGRAIRSDVVTRLEAVLRR